MGHYEKINLDIFCALLGIFDRNANSPIHSVLRGEDTWVFQYTAFGGRWYSDVRRRKVIEHNVISFEKREENTWAVFKKIEHDERNQ